MSNKPAQGQSFWGNFTENLLVSVVAVVFALIAIAVLATLGAPSVFLYGLVLPIAVFVPQIYEQYWSGTHSRGFQIGWTVLMSVLTTVIFVAVYEALHLFISAEFAGLVAIVVTPLGQFAIARAVKGRQPPI